MEFDFETELSKLSREELERLAKSMMTSGVALSFHGKRSAMQIAKKRINSGWGQDRIIS